MPRRENRPCSGSACPDPGLGRECHCRSKRGFKFASDDWCSCACHRNWPWYYREGEWSLDDSEDSDAAVVTYARAPGPETGHAVWVWWALGRVGEAASLDEAKRGAMEALAEFDGSDLAPQP